MLFGLATRAANGPGMVRSTPETGHSAKPRSAPRRRPANDTGLPIVQRKVALWNRGPIRL